MNYFNIYEIIGLITSIIFLIWSIYWLTKLIIINKIDKNISKIQLTFNVIIVIVNLYFFLCFMFFIFFYLNSFLYMKVNTSISLMFYIYELIYYMYFGLIRKVKNKKIINNKS
ncbi:hypothetical protein SCORR_v1c06390 [Spiroplasma corruscae]|uniref:Transmembrane protein n=1 Tax=Spiroplasma corruscae TaxID=216934 RepID=A0A222EPX5_9MOLU|nr:hypothetical protein SCORR_v1c06390 [Spiroplasma corruscae]